MLYAFKMQDLYLIANVINLYKTCIINEKDDLSNHVMRIQFLQFIEHI